MRLLHELSNFSTDRCLLRWVDERFQRGIGDPFGPGPGADVVDAEGHWEFGVLWKREPVHDFQIKNHTQRNMPRSVLSGAHAVPVNLVAQPVWRPDEAEGVKIIRQMKRRLPVRSIPPMLLLPVFTEDMQAHAVVVFASP